MNLTNGILTMISTKSPSTRKQAETTTRRRIKQRLVKLKSGISPIEGTGSTNRARTRAAITAVLAATAAITLAITFQLFPSGAATAEATPLSCAAGVAGVVAGIYEKSWGAAVTGGLVAADQCGFGGKAPDKTSFAGRVIAPAGYRAHIYSRPDLQSHTAGALSDGTAVQIRCTIQGGPATNSDRKTSSLWDKIDGGYLPDVVVATGTDQPTMPSCP